MPERRLIDLAKLIEEMDELTRRAEDEREQLRRDLSAVQRSVMSIFEIMDHRAELAARARRLILELLVLGRDQRPPAGERRKPASS